MSPPQTHNISGSLVHKRKDGVKTKAKNSNVWCGETALNQIHHNTLKLSNMTVKQMPLVGQRKRVRSQVRRIILLLTPVHIKTKGSVNTVWQC